MQSLLPGQQRHGQVGRNAEEEGVNGLFAIPVVFCPYSQKIFHRQRFTPTGVLVHYVPSKRVGAYGDGAYLLLLNLIGLPMEWDKVVAIEGYQELLDYVQEHAEQ